MAHVRTKPVLGAAAATNTMNGKGVSVGAAELEQQVRARIESLSYLPTTVSVAMKFVELGRNPDAGIDEYAKVISADSSLSTKLLSLANSSWFGVRNRVTKVHTAVSLLGLGTIRTLAISYCLTGLHNELHLKPDEAKVFWAASLCKAVAAKQYAMLHNPALADEAFTAGLFQDFALPVMFATARDRIMSLLQDPAVDWKTRLTRERADFKLDHAELARCIAQKLELPDVFIDVVAFHHDFASLNEFASQPVIAEAAYVASLFPHLLDVWNRQDAEEMRRFLGQRHGAQPIDPESYLDAVQRDFNQLYSYFEDGRAPDVTLAELLDEATKEVADNTTRLVGTVQVLLQQTLTAGREVCQLMQQHNRLEEAATRDSLTGVLNRHGFSNRAGDALDKAARYGKSPAMVYFDVDRFKQVNDVGGHAHGDAVLQAVVETIRRNVRANDLVARLGGDEFVLLLGDCTEQNALQAVERILAEIAAREVGKSGKRVSKVTVSAGLVWVEPRGQGWDLEGLLSAADTLMYDAKRAGGNRLAWRHLQTEEKPAA